MAHHGFSITTVPVDKDGLVDPADVEAAVRPDTIMISIMHANNEIGTIQPIAEISSIARKHNILMHTDAAQSAGKIPVDVHELGVDLLSLAGHKLYAPKGVGVLFIREGIDTAPFCHGAGQEGGRRAGTENMVHISGLGMASEIAAQALEDNAEHMKKMRDFLEAGLEENLRDIRFNGHRLKRLPNTCSVSFSGLEANRILEEIGLDIAASAGAACHADTVEISHVLEAIELPERDAKGTLRFTTGRYTTREEIDQAVEIVTTAVKKTA